MRKLLALAATVFLGIFSTTAWSEITLVNPTIASTGASNILMPLKNAKGTSFDTPTFYYSNISANIETNPQGIMIYTGDGTTPCDTNLNSYCHNPGDVFRLNVQSLAATAGSPQMYLLYCGTEPSPQTSISASGCTIISQVAYKDGAAIPALTTTWTDMCSKIAASPMPITDLSSTCTSASFVTDQATLYLMADVNGSFMISSEMKAINVYFASSIPVHSENNTLGLYDFEMQPSLGAVEVRNPMADSAFPSGENTVGIRNARFYYVHSAISNTSYDPAVFAQITPFDTGADFYDVAVLEAGGVLQSGTIHLPNHYRYYFKAALVDMAGNIGYLTEDTDGPRHSAIPQ